MIGDTETNPAQGFLPFAHASWTVLKLITSTTSQKKLDGGPGGQGATASCPPKGPSKFKKNVKHIQLHNAS